MLSSLPLAHAGAPVAPHDLATAWQADPVVVAGLLVAVALHRRGRGPTPDGRTTVAFHAGLAAIALALLSPVEAAAGALMSGHMLQHDLLLLVAAPLLVLSRPGPRLLRGLPGVGRRTVGRTRRSLRVGGQHARAMHHPALGVGALVVALWTWHAADLYGAALAFEPLHVLEHVTLLAGGWLFWSAVAAAVRRGRAATAVAMLFVAALQGVLLGMLLLFSTEAWYDVYAEGAALWGTTPLGDQQVAGLLLWLPASVLYVSTALAVAVRGLNAQEPDAGRGPVVTTGPGGVRSGGVS